MAPPVSGGSGGLGGALALSIIISIAALSLSGYLAIDKWSSPAPHRGKTGNQGEPGLNGLKGDKGDIGLSMPANFTAENGLLFSLGNTTLGLGGTLERKTIIDQQGNPLAFIHGDSAKIVCGETGLGLLVGAGATGTIDDHTAFSGVIRLENDVRRSLEHAKRTGEPLKTDQLNLLFLEQEVLRSIDSYQSALYSIGSGEGGKKRSAPSMSKRTSPFIMESVTAIASAQLTKIRGFVALPDFGLQLFIENNTGSQIVLDANGQTFNLGQGDHTVILQNPTAQEIRYQGLRDGIYTDYATNLVYDRNSAVMRWSDIKPRLVYLNTDSPDTSTAFDDLFPGTADLSYNRQQQYRYYIATDTSVWHWDPVDMVYYVINTPLPMDRTVGSVLRISNNDTEDLTYNPLVLFNIVDLIDGLGVYYDNQTNLPYLRSNGIYEVEAIIELDAYVYGPYVEFTLFYGPDPIAFAKYSGGGGLTYVGRPLKTVFKTNTADSLALVYTGYSGPAVIAPDCQLIVKQIGFF